MQSEKFSLTPEARGLIPSYRCYHGQALMSSATSNPLIANGLDNYLLEVADAVNTTLDLNTLLQRVAEMLKRVMDYEVFAILLLNEKTQELRIRFQVGHPRRRKLHQLRSWRAL